MKAIKSRCLVIFFSELTVLLKKMAKNVKAIYCEATDIGKHIKSTKQKLLWKLKLDDRLCCVELYLSKLSGKVKILVNGDIKLNTKRKSGCAFAYSLNIGKTVLMVLQRGDDYDLRIGNVAFRDLYVSGAGRPHFDVQEIQGNDDVDNREGLQSNRSSCLADVESLQKHSQRTGGRLVATSQTQSNEQAQLKRDMTGLTPSSSKASISLAESDKREQTSKSSSQGQVDLMTPEDLTLPNTLFSSTQSQTFFTSPQMHSNFSSTPYQTKAPTHNPFIWPQADQSQREPGQCPSIEASKLDSSSTASYSREAQKQLQSQPHSLGTNPYKQITPQQPMIWNPMVMMQYMTGMLQQMRSRPQ